METGTDVGPGVGQESELVRIEVNAKEVRISRGLHTVRQVEEAAGCPITFELEQIIHGKLVPLADDAVVDIKGGERFLCHPRDGASS